MKRPSGGGFRPCTGDSKVIERLMTECIDSTMGRIPRMLAVLLDSDDPRTSWSFHKCEVVVVPMGDS